MGKLKRNDPNYYRQYYKDNIDRLKPIRITSEAYRRLKEYIRIEKQLGNPVNQQVIASKAIIFWLDEMEIHQRGEIIKALKEKGVTSFEVLKIKSAPTL